MLERRVSDEVGDDAKPLVSAATQPRIPRYVKTDQIRNEVSAEAASH